jgi:hypothetical protein
LSSSNATEESDAFMDHQRSLDRQVSAVTDVDQESVMFASPHPNHNFAPLNDER